MSMKVVIKTQKDLIEELKKAIADRDNEVVHSIYDFIILSRLKELDPKLVEKLDKLVKGMDFWYA